MPPTDPDPQAWKDCMKAEATEGVYFPSLDERACKVLGWKPQWQCRDCGYFNNAGQSYCSKSFCYGERGGSRATKWPPISTSRDLALKALEELSQKWDIQIEFELHADTNKRWWVGIGIDPRKRHSIGTGPTAPAAIAEAIAALESR